MTSGSDPGPAQHHHLFYIVLPHPDWLGWCGTVAPQIGLLRKLSTASHPPPSIPCGLTSLMSLS